MSQIAMQQNQVADIEIPPPIAFTEAAARKVWELIKEEGNPKLMLRVYITGGGCSGFQYGFTFEETVNADDTVIEKNITKDDGTTVGVKLLVDPMSFQYLAGAEIDYEKKLQVEQFVIRNPNAKTTCGCGSSFAG